MSAHDSSHDTPAPQPSLEEIGVWLVRAEGESNLCEHYVGALPGIIPCGGLLPTEESLTALRPGPGKVLLVSSHAAVTTAWLEQVRASGIGIVVSSAHSLETLFRWGDRAAVVFVPSDPSPETLRLAIISAEMAARREAVWRSACDEHRERLQDRILLERAKSILSERLGLKEEEAYRRLRSLARRQRQPLRQVAQAVIDAGTLLGAEIATSSTVGGDLAQ